jgi:hypothetical protein
MLSPLRRLLKGEEFAAETFLGCFEMRFHARVSPFAAHLIGQLPVDTDRGSFAPWLTDPVFYLGWRDMH